MNAWIRNPGLHLGLFTLKPLGLGLGDERTEIEAGGWMATLPPSCRLPPMSLVQVSDFIVSEFAVEIAVKFNHPHLQIDTPRLADRVQYRECELHALTRFFVRQGMLRRSAQKLGPGGHFFSVALGRISYRSSFAPAMHDELLKIRDFSNHAGAINRQYFLRKSA